MNFEDFRNKIINDLKNKKANINMASVANFKDEKAQDFKYGNINLVEFVSKLSEDDPYSITELYEDTYVLVDKKTKLSPQSFLSPKDRDRLFTDGGKKVLIQTFPEIKDKIEKTFNEISDANCKGCAKNSKFYSLVQEILYLDNDKRDLKPLEGFFENKFLENLKLSPSMKKPELPKNIQQIDQPKKEIESSIVVGQTISKTGKGGPRPSCIACCMKHVGTAIVLLEEANSGYPSHLWLAAGELNEAANEMLRDHPEIANEIREVRLKVTDSQEIPLVMQLLDKLHNLFFSIK